MILIIGREKMNNDNKKLIKVVSTKLSIEDYNFLQQLTTVYRGGTIEELTKSELVRFLVTVSLSSIRQEEERLSLASQKSEEGRNLI